LPDWSRRRLFDIGCGTGGLLAYLGRRGMVLAGACDAYPESLRRTRDRLDIPLVVVDEGRLPPLGPGHELLGMFDVLEHLDDDVGTLQALADALSPGGALVLTVPAHPWLFDEMDELACHRRRYTRPRLRRVLEDGGFEVRYLRHFMFCLVPLLLPVRVLGRLLPGERAAARRQAELRVVPVLNPLMRGLLAVERGITKLAPLPFGTSLVAVGTRRG
jgi:SAM-dependent methyltransferase